LICPKCLGSGFKEGVKCENCKGLKELPQDRCPWHEYTLDMSELLSAYTDYDRFGNYPMKGDRFDQPYLFSDVRNILNTVKNYIDDRKEEQAEAFRKVKNGPKRN